MNITNFAHVQLTIAQKHLNLLKICQSVRITDTRNTMTLAVFIAGCKIIILFEYVLAALENMTYVMYVIGCPAGWHQ